MNENVIGKDGRYPIEDPEVLFRIWSIHQIWMGEAGADRFVAKLSDWVVVPETGETFIVDHIDPVTWVPTLRAIQFGGFGVLSENDRLLGRGPGAPSDTYRVYMNTTVFPYTLSVDTACSIGGTMSSYAKIFLGTDTTEATGKVISKTYDAAGNFISTSVPLEVLALDEAVGTANFAYKAIRRCNCTEKLNNGELVTIVIYADDGHVVYVRQMKIEITDTIADSHVGIRYITDISLECMWLSNMSSDTIEYPLNLPMDSLNMYGVVHYSSGPDLRLPVDGQKFTMDGLTTHVSTIPDQKVPLSLRYELGADERAFSPTGVNKNKITKPYTLVTTNPNNSIEVKLFGYPEWEGEAIGYTMRWFLLNMERQFFADVTPHVKFDSNTGEFRPQQYGYLQRKSVSINLNDVSGNFIPFIHTQLVDIILKQPPSADPLPSWFVLSEASDILPRYGDGVYGRITPDNLLNLAGDFTTQADWLEAYFLKTLPLIDRVNETSVPMPTHFIVSYQGVDTEFPVSSWNQSLNVGVMPTSGKSVVIRFIKRTATIDLQLAFAAAIIKRF